MEEVEEAALVALPSPQLAAASRMAVLVELEIQAEVEAEASETGTGISTAPESVEADRTWSSMRTWLCPPNGAL